jgi:hypothetical protein
LGCAVPTCARHSDGTTGGQLPTRPGLGRSCVWQWQRGQVACGPHAGSTTCACASRYPLAIANEPVSDDVVAVVLQTPQKESYCKPVSNHHTQSTRHITHTRTACGRQLGAAVVSAGEHHCCALWMTRDDLHASTAHQCYREMTLLHAVQSCQPASGMRPASSSSLSISLERVRVVARMQCKRCAGPQVDPKMRAFGGF